MYTYCRRIIHQTGGSIIAIIKCLIHIFQFSLFACFFKFIEGKQNRISFICFERYLTKTCCRVISVYVTVDVDSRVISVYVTVDVGRRVISVYVTVDVGSRVISVYVTDVSIFGVLSK